MSHELLNFMSETRRFCKPAFVRDTRVRDCTRLLDVYLRILLFFDHLAGCSTFVWELSALVRSSYGKLQAILLGCKLLFVIVSRCGLAVRRKAGKQKDLGSIRFGSPFSSKIVVYRLSCNFAN